jgi:hypothetical protein
VRLAVPAPRTLGLGGLLFELVLPVALSASVLLALAGYMRSWDLHSRVGLGIFAVLLVMLSLVVSLRVDAFTLARRRERGKAQILNRADSRTRLAKFIGGGLVIPILAFVGANRLELPNHRTPMSQVVQWRLQSPEGVHAEQIAGAALRASRAATKIQGILALRALGSDEALEQLFRLLNDDPTTLSDSAESQALSQALASYGIRAKPKLVQQLAQVVPNAAREEATPSFGLFDRYFSSAFDGVRSEVSAARSDAPAQAKSLERLQAAQANLEEALRQVEADAQPDPAATGLPGFILRTFLQMDVKQDAEVLEIARRIAADDRWSMAIRGQSLLLIAKLGDADNMNELFGYLDNPELRLQAVALKAIAGLQSKVSSAAATR